MRKKPFSYASDLFHRGRITRKEKKKLMIYVAMIIFGTMFVTSLRELFIDKFLQNYPPSTLFILSALAIGLLYYLLKMD